MQHGLFAQPSSTQVDVVAAAAQSSENTNPTEVHYWTPVEDAALKISVEANDSKNWKLIAKSAFPDNSRSDIQCLHRWKKVLSPHLVKGPWSPEEDAIVSRSVIDVGVSHVKWAQVALKIPGRLGKQVRERWYNHLDPLLAKGPWTPEEDAALVKWQAAFGNKWVKIAEQMRGRSENGIKNRWNSAKRRRGGTDKRKGNSGKSKSKNGSGGGSTSSTSSNSSKRSRNSSDSSSTSSSSSSSSSSTSVADTSNLEPAAKKTKVDI